MIRSPTIARLSANALKTYRTQPLLTRSIITTRYTKEQNIVEWDTESKTATVFLARQQAGENRAIRSLPKVGGSVPLGGAVGNVQGSLGDITLRSPISGTVTEVNDRATSQVDSEGRTWVYKIKAVRPTEIESLMTKQQYLDFLEENLDTAKREQLQQEIESSSGPKWRQLHRYQEQLLNA